MGEKSADIPKIPAKKVEAWSNGAQNPSLEHVLDGDVVDTDQSKSALRLQNDADDAWSLRAKAAVDSVTEKYRRQLGDQLVRLHEAGEIRFKHRALNMRSRIVSEGYEGTLADRHNDRLISPQFVQAVLRGDADFLKRLYKEAQEHGFFLFPYSVEEMYQRITAKYPTADGSDGTPQFIIRETGGTHPVPGNRYYVEGKTDKVYWAAESHIHLPALERNAAPVVELPKEGDEEHQAKFISYLQSNPSRVAVIEDVFCARNMSKTCLGSAAVNSSLRDIAGVNESRGEDHKISHVATAIATLRGVRLPSGKEIMLKDSITNERSTYMIDNFRSPVCERFILAYILRNRECPVVLDGDDPKNPHMIILDWYVRVGRLKQESKTNASTQRKPK